MISRSQLACRFFLQRSSCSTSRPVQLRQCSLLGPQLMAHFTDTRGASSKNQPWRWMLRNAGYCTQVSMTFQQGLPFVRNTNKLGKLKLHNRRLGNLASIVREFNPSSLFSRRIYFFSSDAVLWTLIGTNVAVFALWQLLDMQFMVNHFTVSVDSVLNGRLYTILTYAFSQKDFGHLLSNLLMLYVFGWEIGKMLGGSFLLKFYVSSAVGGAIGHLLYYTYIYPWLKNIPQRYFHPRFTPPALGASAAVTAITLLSIFLYPQRMIFCFFVPMPAALVGVIMIGQDLWSARQGGSRISEGGHLGGAVVSVLYYFYIKKLWL